MTETLSHVGYFRIIENINKTEGSFTHETQVSVSLPKQLEWKKILLLAVIWTNIHYHSLDFIPSKAKKVEAWMYFGELAWKMWEEKILCVQEVANNCDRSTSCTHTHNNNSLCTKYWPCVFCSWDYIYRCPMQNRDFRIVIEKDPWWAKHHSDQ